MAEYPALPFEDEVRRRETRRETEDTIDDRDRSLQGNPIEGMPNMGEVYHGRDGRVT